jgi:hemerythrin-like domain-containing protein
MNKQLDEAISRLRELPEERQQAAAALLVDFLDHERDSIDLSPQQITEIEAALVDDENATDEEVEAFFARLGK